MDIGIGQRLERLRATAPLIHNITNYVAMNVMANTLLAIGAAPAMIHAEEEAGEFAGIAHALTINIGTLSPPWVRGMVAAIQGARGAAKPWVFDPVGVGATNYRRWVSADLLNLRPTVIKGNASEILALGAGAGAGRGVDSADAVDAAEAAARHLATTTGAIVAVTGPVDLVTDGARVARVSNGHAMMPKVTALGCSLTGVVAAFLAANPDEPFEATVAALAVYGIAGEMAGATTSGPGSFAVAFLDALHAITPAEADARARVSL